MRQLEDMVVSLLRERFSPDRALELARLLTRGTWTHDYPITVDAAKEMGLPVDTDVPEALDDLMQLYPQPVHRMPSVEYLPGRRRAPSSTPGGPAS